MNPKVLPPKVPPNFWTAYSKHVSAIKLSDFEMEEIERIVDAHGTFLDCYINFEENSKLRRDLLNMYRNDLIVRAWRGGMLAQLEIVRVAE